MCRETSLSPPVKYFTDRSRALLLLWILFVVCVLCLSCFLSFHFSLMVNCWERANLLACLYKKFSLYFVTLPCGVLGQVSHKIILIPDLLPLTYFDTM